ncbi:hypothetical protein R5R35_013550 [Gryllus longicercus]|uniref:DUF8207 domain-containing protein n=1 Tax=Gryllus longicercus TaxID=2509291 RepID=A0AAN9Z2M3_9ORTH
MQSDKPITRVSAAAADTKNHQYADIGVNTTSFPKSFPPKKYETDDIFATSSSSLPQKRELQGPIKDEEEEEEEDAEEPIPFGAEGDGLWSERLLAAWEKKSDTAYGPYFIANTLYVGNKEMDINNDGTFTIADRVYDPSPGLLDLLFEKRPNIKVIPPDDMANYKQILTDTSAHKMYYNHGAQYETAKNRWKYRFVIAKLFPRRRNPKRQLLQKVGRGLRFVKAADAADYYKYWRDPNTLVDRLRLLRASKAAGNNGHDGELVEIEEELRSAGIIA